MVNHYLTTEEKIEMNRSGILFDHYFERKTSDVSAMKLTEIKVILNILKKTRPLLNISLSKNKPQLVESLKNIAFSPPASTSTSISNSNSTLTPISTTISPSNTPLEQLRLQEINRFRLHQQHQLNLRLQQQRGQTFNQSQLNEQRLLQALQQQHSNNVHGHNHHHQYKQNQTQVNQLNSALLNTTELIKDIPPSNYTDTLSTLKRLLYNVQTTNPKPIITFNEPSYEERQTPFLEETEKLFVSYYTNTITQFFDLDEQTWKLVEEVQEKKLKGLPITDSDYSVQLRLYNKSTQSDIIYNSDLHIDINSKIISHEQFKKVRSRVFQNPFIIQKPIDITQYLKRQHNRILINFRCTSGYVVIQLAKGQTVKQICDKIKERSEIETQSSDKKQKKSEDDLEELMFDISLRCPLSFKKIEYPGKSRKCTHNQCFDLLSFVEYSNQQQLWNCPICHVPAPPSLLQYDLFFHKLMVGAPPNCEIITLYIDGHWEYKVDGDSGSNNDSDSESKNDFPKKPINSSSNNVSILANSNNNNNNVVVVELLDSDDESTPTVPTVPTVPSVSVTTPLSTSSNSNSTNLVNNNNNDSSEDDDFLRDDDDEDDEDDEDNEDDEDDNQIMHTLRPYHSSSEVIVLSDDD